MALITDHTTAHTKVQLLQLFCLQLHEYRVISVVVLYNVLSMYKAPCLLSIWLKRSVVPDLPFADYCAPGCPWWYVGDNYCDESCMVEECYYDFGDCGERNCRNHSVASDRWGTLLSIQLRLWLTSESSKCMTVGILNPSPNRAEKYTLASLYTPLTIR